MTLGGTYIIAYDMARPLRIQYPDAWYHVMNRGRRGEQIFATRRDYFKFIDLLQDTSEIWNLRITAFCLMPNHYHLLAQTPDANISRCMRHIDGVYTQFFNRRHNCDGPLFRGRYKSILVEADHYVLQLVKYIHRNPLKAGLTNTVGQYPWSSHKGYVSNAQKWNWLHKDFVLSMLTPRKNEQVKRYKYFITAQDDDTEAVIKVFDQRRWPAMLGSNDFIERIKSKFFLKTASDEIPQVKELAPDVDRVKKVVCKVYDISETELMRSKRGEFNEPRNVAIYLSRNLTGENLKSLAEHFDMNKYSSVSSVIVRIKTLISSDRKLRRKVDQLRNLILKSQEQT